MPQCFLRKKPYFPVMRLIIFFICTILSLPIEGQFIERTEEGYEVMRVYYGGGSYYLDQTQRNALLEWLANKEDLREYEILVRSHTDNIGSQAYNLYLSQMRSESVVHALNEVHIAREEIRIEDFGEDDPAYDNETLQGRLNNRRVDVILVPPSS
jgi:outer membrane protein OmpA-like peptidoglycan-associated protein